MFDRRDIGSKDQQGSRPTRYGDADSLRRCIANAHAVGLDVYHDVVLHQLIGENGGPGVFRYLGADERPNIGRGAMNPGCFRGIPPANRPEDAVPVPFFDFAFGDERWSIRIATRRGIRSRMPSTTVTGCSAPQTRTAAALTTSGDLRAVREPIHAQPRDGGQVPL